MMNVERDPTEARQATPEGVVRYVLAISFAGAAIALATIYLVFV